MLAREELWVGLGVKGGRPPPQALGRRHPNCQMMSPVLASMVDRVEMPEARG